MKWYRITLSICSLVGIVLSGLSVQNHYSKDETTYCSIDATFNCDIVNRSTYSQIMGIPVALVGVLGYVVLLGLALRSTRRRESWMLLFASLPGLGFALYLTYIEEHILQTWCLLCLGSLLAIVAITLMAVVNLRHHYYGPHPVEIKECLRVSKVQPVCLFLPQIIQAGIGGAPVRAIRKTLSAF